MTLRAATDGCADREEGDSALKGERMSTHASSPRLPERDAWSGTLSTSPVRVDLTIDDAAVAEATT